MEEMEAPGATSESEEAMRANFHRSGSGGHVDAREALHVNCKESTDGLDGSAARRGEREGDGEKRAQ